MHEIFEVTDIFRLTFGTGLFIAAPISLSCAATAPLNKCSTPHHSANHAIQRSQEEGNQTETHREIF